MAFDEALAQRVRGILARHSAISERKMMGALCFMAGGHMCCGVTRSALMVRVGREGQEQALASPHVRLMQIGGRPVAGFVEVDRAGLPTDDTIVEWTQRGIDFAATLPPKRRGAKPKL